MKKTKDILKNTVETVEIIDNNPDGNGVGRLSNNAAVFVPGTLAGDIVKVKIIKSLSDKCIGRLVEIIKPSKDRIDSDCEAFPRCGGCTFRHASREAELNFKLRLVNRALQSIAKTSVKCENIYSADCNHYRNKAIYPIFTDKNGKLAAGFYSRHSHNAVAMKSCMIEGAEFEPVRNFITEYFTEKGVTAYDEETKKGKLRYIYLRKNRKSELCVTIITAKKRIPALTEGFASALCEKFPNVVSVWQNFNPDDTNVALGKEFILLKGSETMTDTLCGRKFEISPASFYQVNAQAAEMLYYKAAEYADIKDGETVLDLYCGAGTVGICAVPDGANLFGAEIVPQAVENAAKNALLNKRSPKNTAFICADSEKGVQCCTETFKTVNAIFADPPRKGLDKKVISDICNSGASRTVYISCNPATLARDIKIFEENGFKLAKCSAFDLFPRTGHVECVSLLVRE